MATYNYYNSSDNNMWREYEGVFSGNAGFVMGKTDVNCYGALRFEDINMPQGTTVTEAVLKVYVGEKGSGSGNLKYSMRGFDEDNTAEFSSSPFGRSTTDANYSGEASLTSVGNFQHFTVTNIVNEILGRSGWSSGNAIGFKVDPNDCPSQVYIYDSNTGTSTNSYLTITYEESSPSASQSPSSSVSNSPSTTPSSSPSVSNSPSPSTIEPFFGLKIAKPNKNVLTTDDPRDLIFSSDYGTLKYFETGELTITTNGDDVGSVSFTHNLGYYPYFEVYLLNPIGEWEYCPTINGGASTVWSVYVQVTTTTLDIYVGYGGFEEETTFDFKYFIYKNDLKL